MKNFREIEQLSAYLDGKLDSLESKRLESRLHADPELASVYNDLRSTRALLRKLPTRKAPRNFTLTRQMVGLKPPLPRSYPILRLATVFAAFLFMFSLTANALSPYVSFSAPSYGGFGMGGGAPEQAEAPAAEEPLMEIAPPAPAEGAATEAEPQMDSMQTQKQGEVEQEALEPARVQGEAPVSAGWQIGFLIIAVVSGLLTWSMRRAAARKWR
jgi:anti-sigma factor RsiW